MITIFFSRKGGAGKSTLAAQMASRLASDGETVAIFDADPQGTAGNWAVYRRGHDRAPGITLYALESGSALNEALDQLSPNFDHVIVDLQGGDSKENRKTLLRADKLVIPFKASQPDLDNIPHIARMLEELHSIRPELEVHLVLNEAPSTTAKVPETEEARIYFASYKLRPLDSIIHSRKAYRDSMATGLGACELKDKKAKAEIDGLWSEIYRDGRGGASRRRQSPSKSSRTADKRKKA